jgi:hypothetical protein
MYGTKQQDVDKMYIITTNDIVPLESPWDIFPYRTLLNSIEYRHHIKVIVAVKTWLRKYNLWILFLQTKRY